LRKNRRLCQKIKRTQIEYIIIPHFQKSKQFWPILCLVPKNTVSLRKIDAKMALHGMDKTNFLSTTLHSIGEENEEDQKNKPLIGPYHANGHAYVTNGPFE